MRRRGWLFCRPRYCVSHDSLKMAWLYKGTGNDSTLEVPFCPRTFNCSDSRDEQHLVSFDIGKDPSYIAIASSSLSCLGSILIFTAFLSLRDLRTGAQRIITFLALADFISAAGYIVGSSNFIIHFNVNERHECKVFETICEIQASITSWSSLSSFAWTLILAFYFYLVIVFNRRALAVKLMPLYHLIAWIFPLAVIVPLSALRKLGYAPYAASNWCFVKNLNYTTSLGDEYIIILIIFLAGKLWEILTYIGVVVVYAHIVARMSKRRRRHGYVAVQGAASMEQVERRLLYIPLFFLVLRIWGTLQFFYSIAVSSTNKNGCIPHTVQTVFLVFGVFQAIGDPGQGWGNAILYIFLSPVVRTRLIFKPMKKAARAVCLDLLLEPSSYQDNQDCPPVSNDGHRDRATDDVNVRQRLVQRQSESRPSSVSPEDRQTGNPISPPGAAGFQPSYDATSQGSTNTSKVTPSMPV